MSWQKQRRPTRLPGDEQKGLVWPVTATNEYRNMRGCQGSDLLHLLVIGDSFGPKQPAKTAGMACQGGSSKMLSREVHSPLFPPTELPRRGHKGRGWCSRGRDRAGSNTVLLRATPPFSLEMNEVVSACQMYRHMPKVEWNYARLTHRSRKSAWIRTNFLCCFF